MRTSIFFSVFLHALVISIGVLGLPIVRSTPILHDVPMVVEILPMALKTNLPSVSELEIKPAKKIKKNKTEDLNSVKPKRSKMPSSTINKSKKSEVIVPVSKPKPREVKKDKPKPTRKRKVQSKPKLNKVLIDAKPRRKPKPPDRFAMVLKNLEKDLAKKKFVNRKVKEEKSNVKSDIISRLSKSLSKASREYNSNKQITMSQRDAMINIIKRTMEPCWNFQAGSKKAQDIVVEIEVALKADGRVLSARITNQSQLSTDPFRQAAGESALRAVLNPSCQPYRLPVNLFHEWKDLKLRFNPKEMLGR